MRCTKQAYAKQNQAFMISSSHSKSYLLIDIWYREETKMILSL